MCINDPRQTSPIVLEFKRHVHVSNPAITSADAPPQIGSPFVMTKGGAIQIERRSADDYIRGDLL